jgi:enterochelin esterase-like enzyme
VTTRRAFLLGSVAAATSMAFARRARSQVVARAPFASELDVRDVRVEGDLSRRMTLCVPKHLLPHERVPLLVLLHGLNETAEERMGAYAWLERYGLGAAYDRLRKPPLARVDPARSLWTDARVAELNADLAQRPFRGMVVACPYMPDLQIGSASELNRYASWITDIVIPRAHKEAPTIADPRFTTIDGCSLGGHFSLEVFLRKPEAFGAWGGVQTAIGEASAVTYAERIARVLGATGAKPIHVETSTGDAFRRGNEALHAELQKRGVAHELLLLPGPHDQAFLRESGTLEMLRWHDQLPRPQKRIAR